MAKIEMTIDSVRRGLLRESWSMILKEKSGERYLPVYIDRSYVDTIKKKLLNAESAKPVNCDLSISGVNMTSCKLQSVTIGTFVNNVFHTKISLTWRDRLEKVDCTAGKALTLGIMAEVPIFAEEAVLDKAGIDVSYMRQMY